MRRGNTIFFLLLILLLGGGAFYVDFQSVFAGQASTSPDTRINSSYGRGLICRAASSSSSMRIVHRRSQNATRQSVMPQVVDNINRRIAQGLAVSEASVRVQRRQCVGRASWLHNAAQASALLGKTGEMNIIDTGSTAGPVGTVVTPGQYPVKFTGSTRYQSNLRRPRFE